MAKKSFKDNPALQFISEAEKEPTQDKDIIKPKEKAPDGYKLNPIYLETKTRRLQLVLQPSLFERVKACAEAKGMSINEYVHQALDIATKKEGY